MLDIILLVIASLLTIWFFTLSKSENALLRLMIWAFSLRFILLFLDYYHIIVLPGSGGDTETFHEYALNNQGSSIKDYLTNYSLFLTYLYAVTDCSRLFAQYLNLIMGMFTILWLNKAMKLANIDNKYRFRCIKILAFLPNVAIFSVILLREAWVELFIIISVYYFVKWFNDRKGIKNICISFVCIIAAAWMHVGCIALLFGYMICVLIYDRKAVRVHFSRYSIAAMIIMAVFIIVLLAYADSFFSRLSQYSGLASDEFIEAVMGLQDSVEAESAYLTWLSYSNPVHLVLFVPLKMFYFLYSPIPFDWRGMMDIVAFLLDSSIYLFLSYKIVSTSIVNKKFRYLRNFLLIGFLVITFMLAMGTISSGTAIRHRAKILSLLLVCYGITMSYNKKSIAANE